MTDSEDRKKQFDDVSKALTEFEILCKDSSKIYDEVNQMVDTLKVDAFKNDTDFESWSISSKDIETDTLTGFSNDILKSMETYSNIAKTIGEKFAATRPILGQLNSSMEIKATEITKTEIAKLSDNLIQLMSNLSEFRTQLRTKFDRLLSKQLKSLGMPHNKRTLIKALETDFTPTLLATRKGTGIIHAIEFFRCIKNCHIAVSSLDSSLYTLYDEFSKTAEILVKFDIILEAVIPPLAEAIAFTNYQRRVMQRGQKIDGDDSTNIILTPHRKNIRFLTSLLTIGIIGFIISSITFIVVLFLKAK